MEQLRYILQEYWDRVRTAFRDRSANIGRHEQRNWSEIWKKTCSNLQNLNNTLNVVFGFVSFSSVFSSSGWLKLLKGWTVCQIVAWSIWDVGIELSVSFFCYIQTAVARRFFRMNFVFTYSERNIDMRCRGLFFRILKGEQFRHAAHATEVYQKEPFFPFLQHFSFMHRSYWSKRDVICRKYLI